MRNIVFFSVLLNLGLVGFVGYQFSSKGKQSSAEVEQPAQSSSRTERLKSYRVQTATEMVTNTFVRRFSWERVEAEDYKIYIANLRQIECPEETIRDIIIADVNKYYAKQLAPLRKPREQTPFWRNEQHWGSHESAEYHAKHRELEKEKRELLRELLGVDYLQEMRKQWGWYREDPLMESLSVEVKDQIQDIQMKYNEMRSEVYRKARGHMDEEDQKELNKIEKQLHAEMAGVLSPDQLFEYQVRHSQAASSLKNNELKAFDATEEEFRAIVRARLADEAARSRDDSSGAARSATRAEIQKESEEQLRAALGEERYAEYKLASDWEYRNLVELVTQRDLPRSAAKDIHSMKDEVQKVTRLIQANKELTADQRKEQLQLVRAETEKAITELLGEKGFKSYSRNAWWLRQIGRN